ncbi:MAG TPA: chemotaxis response regulator protein-glutamate methylesterase [Bryobacteraceae bacterium]|nr:chemotaxis response regulator protein-glutamate methylesterase [Bryobacteraceae bacterium]
MPAGRKIRVLIVDDSAIVRKALSDIVAAHPDLEVAGTASDPFVARDKILALKPDVLTLDIEMPRMDGLTFLKKLMRFHPLPVVMVSSLGQASSRVAIEALQYGAVDVVAKPGGPYSVTEMREELARKIHAAAHASLRRTETPGNAAAHAPAPTPAPAPAHASPAAVIGIGASTGGVEALGRVLMQLPAEMPPIVVTQHIPPVFSAEFARRLDKSCRVRVKEAEQGDRLEPGRVLIAPGNYHLTIERAGNGYRAVVRDGERVQYQRPSVDVLFQSIARQAGPDAVGAILTGMGADGAAGLLAMKQAGARTFAQDEASCVVFGMPREAILAGAVDEILPLDRIAAELARFALRPAGRPAH